MELVAAIALGACGIAIAFTTIMIWAGWFRPDRD